MDTPSQYLTGTANVALTKAEANMFISSELPFGKASTTLQTKSDSLLVNSLTDDHRLVEIKACVSVDGSKLSGLKMKYAVLSDGGIETDLVSLEAHGDVVTASITRC